MRSIASSLVLATVALASLACIHAPAVAPVTHSRQGDTLEVGSPITGAVLVDVTMAPIASATVFIDGRAGQAATDSLGRFSLPTSARGHAVLVVRRIGYGIVRIPVRIDSVVSSRELSVTLKTIAQIEDEWRARLREPTAVTPCRPRDAMAHGEQDGLRRLLTPQPGTVDSLVQKIGLGRLVGVVPEQVIDPVLCARAAEAIDLHEQTPRRGTQVYLFRLGNRGWAAYDPSIPAGEWKVTHFLDERMQVITGVAW
jgi:hypothetical protein